MTGNCYINYRARLRRRGKLHRGELLGPAHFVCFDQHTPPRAGLAGEMLQQCGVAFVPQLARPLLGDLAPDLRHAPGWRAGARRKRKHVQMRQAAFVH